MPILSIDNVSYGKVAQTVKNLPAMQETRFWSLGLEDPLEKEMATHSSILAWKIPGTEEPGGLQSMWLKRVRHDWSDLHACMHALEKEMATHSSVLAWKIPGTEEPGRLQSMGSLRVGHDWATSLSQICFKNRLWSLVELRTTKWNSS